MPTKTPSPCSAPVNLRVRSICCPRAAHWYGRGRPATDPSSWSTRSRLHVAALPRAPRERRRGADTNRRHCERGAVSQTGPPRAFTFRGRRRDVQRDPRRGAAVQGRGRDGRWRWQLRRTGCGVSCPDVGRGVNVLVRGPGLAESMSRYLIQRIEDTANIALRVRTELDGLEGADASSWFAGATSTPADRRRVRSVTSS
jgi:hypothetical protein